MTYAERRQKIERFVLVYVFCKISDTVCPMANPSGWCKFQTTYKDEVGCVSATVFATMYDTGTGQLRREQKPTGEISRECRSLLEGDFSTKIEIQTSRLYPNLFARIRQMGFTPQMILVRHHDREHTVYQLDRNSIRIIAEKKRA